MKKIFQVVTVIICCLCFLFQLEFANAKTNNDLTWFGFYAHPVCGDFSAVGLSEFEKIANVYVELCVDENVALNIQKLREKKIKPAVSLMQVFFEAGEDYKWRLRSDYQARWRETAAKLTGMEKDVHSFYLVDEPMVHGISNQEVQIASDAVKNLFPAVSILIVESGLWEYLEKFNPPASADLLAIDIYGIFNPREDDYYQKSLRLLKSKKFAHQRIILIADGVRNNAYSEEDYIKMAESYYALADSDSEVAGIFVFLWNGNESPEIEGIKKIGNRLVQKWAEISREIVGGDCFGGLVIQRAFLNGKEWTGKISIRCSIDGIIGPIQEVELPVYAYFRSPGDRQCEYVFGGPKEAFLPLSAQQNFLFNGEVAEFYWKFFE